ncbi:hypothetical protein LTR53_019017, partial [Teratosphaeriaceae sp. CCFEE 6253]
YAQYDNLRALILGGRKGGSSSKYAQRVFCASLPEIGGVARGVGGYRSLTDPAAEAELAQTMAAIGEGEVVETAPSSPPALSYSKSSKSSDSSPSNSVVGDASTDTLAHFEDVTLDETDRNSVGDCNVKPESRPTLRRPVKRTSTAGSVET